MAEQDLEKKYQKRKDIVKNIAIIFLVIMLLLTFFSNTIMNYSLAEVETAYAESGTLTTKIRGEGYVEAREPVDVSCKKEREILKILVKEGDKVKKGQVLFVLAGESSADALNQAKSDLMTLNHEYAKSLLEMPVPGYASDSLEIKYAKKDLARALKDIEDAKKENIKKKEMYAKLKEKAGNAKEAMLEKADEVAEKTDEISQIDIELESLENEKAELGGENDGNLQELNAAVTSAKREAEDAEDKVKQYGDSSTATTIEEELKAKKKELKDLQRELSDLTASLNESMTEGADDTITSLNRKIRDCKAEISDLHSQAADANANISELNYLYSSADDETREQYWQQLASAKQEYNSINKQIEAKERELDDLEEDLEIAKKNAAVTVNKKVGQIRKDISEKEEDISEVQNQINSLENEKSLAEGKKAQLETAEAELYNAQKKLKEAQRQLEDAQSALKTENSAKLRQIEDNIKKLKGQKSRLSSQKTKLESLYAQLQADYEAAKAKVDSYQKADDSAADTLNQTVQEKRKALETLYVNLAKEKKDDKLKIQMASLDNEQKAETIQKKKNEISRLKKKRKNLKIRAKLAGTISDITAKTGENTANAKVTATGGDFFFFHQPVWLSGFAYSDNDVMKDRAVIDKELAWKLFGGENVAGMPFTINGSTYYVAGVVDISQQEEEKKTYGDMNRAWLPYSAFCKEYQIQNNTSGETGNTTGTGEKTDKIPITCYETVIPNPVQGWALDLMQKSLGAENRKMVITENSKRTDFFYIMDNLKNFFYQTSGTQPVAYPYWENAAKVRDTKRELYTGILIIAVIYPVLLCIRIIAWIYKTADNRIKKRLNKKHSIGP